MQSTRIQAAQAIQDLANAEAEIEVLQKLLRDRVMCLLRIFRLQSYLHFHILRMTVPGGGHSELSDWL